MVALATPQPAAEKVAYKSPKHAQVWFLRRSRDLWKKKHHGLKVDAKRLQNRVADVIKSRDRWRRRAEVAERRLTQPEQQQALLRAQLQSPAEKKGEP